MFDLSDDPFGHSDAFGPAARAPATPVSASPFARLYPEDRSALATRKPCVRHSCAVGWVSRTRLPRPGLSRKPGRRVLPPQPTRAVTKSWPDGRCPANRT